MRSLAAVAVLAFATAPSLAFAEAPPQFVISGHTAYHPVVLDPSAVPNLINSHTLFLNRCAPNGCAVKAGNMSDSTQHISDIAGGNVMLSAFSGGDTNWNAIKSCVAKIMQPYNITVTDVDPGAAPHFEVMVAGTAGQLNTQLNGQGILGIADYACQAPGQCFASYFPNALVFAFANDPYYGSGTNYDVLEACGTAAQEIAHAWTLDHTTSRSDPMTYNQYTNPLTFKNGVTCGSDCGNYNGCGSCNAFGVTCSNNTHLCMSSGQSTQDEDSIIKSLFGPAGAAPPTVKFKTPTNGSAEHAGFTVEVDCTSSDGVQEVDVTLDGQAFPPLTTAPYTETTSATLAKGNHHVEALCGTNNQATATAKADFIIGDPCTTDTDCMMNYICYEKSCVAGPMAMGGLGATCMTNADCSSGSCASDGTMSSCVIPCDPSAAQCPSGFGCLASNAGGVCWAGLDNGGGGCCDSGSSGSAGSILLGLGFAATLVTRRKRKQ